MRYGNAGVGSGHRLAARFLALNPTRDQITCHQPTEAEADVVVADAFVTADGSVLDFDTSPIPDVAKPTVGRGAQLVPLWISRPLGRLVRLRARPIPNTA